VGSAAYLPFRAEGTGERYQIKAPLNCGFTLFF